MREPIRHDPAAKRRFDRTMTMLRTKREPAVVRVLTGEGVHTVQPRTLRITGERVA